MSVKQSRSVLTFPIFRCNQEKNFRCSRINVKFSWSDFLRTPLKDYHLWVGIFEKIRSNAFDRHCKARNPRKNATYNIRNPKESTSALSFYIRIIYIILASNNFHNVNNCLVNLPSCLNFLNSPQGHRNCASSSIWKI